MKKPTSPKTTYLAAVRKPPRKQRPFAHNLLLNIAAASRPDGLVVFIPRWDDTVWCEDTGYTYLDRHETRRALRNLIADGLVVAGEVEDTYHITEAGQVKAAAVA